MCVLGMGANQGVQAPPPEFDWGAGNGLSPPKKPAFSPPLSVI